MVIKDTYLYQELTGEGISEVQSVRELQLTLGPDINIIEVRPHVNKYCIRFVQAFAHFIFDNMSAILKIHEADPDGVFLLYDDMNATENALSTYDYLEELLTHIGVPYHRFKTTMDDYKGVGTPYKVYKDVAKVDRYVDVFNYLAARPELELSMKDHKKLSDAIADHLSGSEEVSPYRKIYLSRREMPKRDNLVLSPSDRPDLEEWYTNDIRMPKEELLEDFLKSKGYEIVIPEKHFRTFREQVEYMRTVKTLISVTSSGLTNILFMQDKQTVIEIVTEQISIKNARPVHQFLEKMYHFTSYMKEHLYVGIASRREPIDVIKKLTTIEKIL